MHDRGELTKIDAEVVQQAYMRAVVADAPAHVVQWLRACIQRALQGDMFTDNETRMLCGEREDEEECRSNTTQYSKRLLNAA